MKLVGGVVGYVGAAVLAMLFLFGVWYVMPRSEASVPAVTQSAAIVQTTPGTIAAASEAERVPVWIVPTTKYPPEQFKVSNAPRARELARGGGVREDWRLSERQARFEPAVELNGYAPFSTQREPAGRTRYREPMQYREKTEPR